MRLNRLFTRLLLLLVPVTLMFLVFHMTLGMRAQEQLLRQELELRARSLGGQFAILSGYALASFNEWLLPQHVERLAHLPGVDYCLVLDPNGMVQFHSDHSQEGSVPQDAFTRAALDSAFPLLRYSRAGAEPSELSDSTWLPHQLDPYDRVDVAVPIRSGANRLGTVRLGLSLDDVKGSLRGSYRSLLQASAVLVGLAVALLAWVARKFSLPILRLADKANHLAKTPEAWESEPTIILEETGELAVLEAALTGMSARVREFTRREKEQRLRMQSRIDALLELTGKVAEGHLKVRSRVGSGDEVGRLESGFNEMVERLMRTRRAELQAQLDVEWVREELERHNRRLQELDRRKTDFLNTASHELRTPLTSIRAFAEIILDNLDGPPEDFLADNEEFLNIIHSESDRLSRLIGSLLDLSRIESGGHDWEFEEVSIQELLVNCVQACRSLLQDKHLQLKFDMEDSGLAVYAARDPLLQVFTNLLSNAIKFTPAGGHIALRARAGDEQVVVEVEDSGIGIAAEDLGKLFESFQQAESSAGHDQGKQAIRGSGLGLSIVKQIVERHGGVIKVQSQLGRGSCFMVRIPLGFPQTGPA